MKNKAIVIEEMINKVIDFKSKSHLTVANISICFSRNTINVIKEDSSVVYIGSTRLSVYYESGEIEYAIKVLNSMIDGSVGSGVVSICCDEYASYYSPDWRFCPYCGDTK